MEQDHKRGFCITLKIAVTSKDDLEAKAIGALRRLQKLPATVRAFFADPTLRYITDAA